MALKIDGLDELNAELARMAKEMPEAVQAGCFAGALLIQGEAQRNTPVEHGDLQGSAYTNLIPLGAETGFSEDFAMWVHENLEQKLRGQPRPSGLGTYWNPGGPKFLENAVNDNLDTVRDLVKAQVEKTVHK